MPRPASQSIHLLSDRDALKHDIPVLASDPSTKKSSSASWRQRRASSARDGTTDTMDTTSSLLSVDVATATAVPAVLTDALWTAHTPRGEPDDSDMQLWTQTEAVASPLVDVDSLGELSLDQWDLRAGGLNDKKSGGFRVFSRVKLSPTAPALTEVLAMGELPCSLAEAAGLLRNTSESRFSAAMDDLYGRAFRSGSVVHRFKPTNEKPTTPAFLTTHRCVKTATFARPHLAVLHRGERWCFLEHFAALPADSESTREGFTLSQRSLRPGALPRAVRPPVKLTGRRRSCSLVPSNKEPRQLLGLSTAFKVEVMTDRHPATVSVVFYGRTGDANGNGTVTAERRLLELARGVLKLPEMVRRRHMSAQVPADLSVFSHLSSRSRKSRCVCCTRSLHALRLVKKTRCYLCAHFVCSRCWVRQPLENANGHQATVLVCSHCVDSVDRCNYANLTDFTVSTPLSEGSSMSTSNSDSGTPLLRLARVLPDAKDAPAPGDSVTSRLEEVLSGQQTTDATAGDDVDFEIDTADACHTRTQAAMHVLRQLVGVLDQVSRNLDATAPGVTVSNDVGAPNDSTVPELSRLKQQFASKAMPLQSCVLSNASTRSYAIDTSGCGSTDAVPETPIPANEAHRLESIAKDNLLAASGCEELKLICELATRELGCMGTLVTIVGGTHQHVLAADLPGLGGAELPREHTFCQHLLMGDKPMLVQNPEADVRFRNMNPVVQNGIQFYGGFPIFSRDGQSVVGSICCLDVRPREVTQSQYSTLTQLTGTAGRIIEMKGRQACVQ